MKVQEIISEGFWDKALGAGAKLAGKMLPSAEETASKALANVWAKEIAAGGKATTKAGTVIGPKLAKDKAVIAAAKAEAQKLAPSLVKSANIAIIKGGAQAFNSKIATLTKWGISVVPLVQYNIRMNKWAKKLEAGEITQAEFDEIRQKEMATMVGQMVVGLASAKVFQSVANGTKFLTDWIPGVRTILAPILAAAPTIGMGLTTWWASTEGREWITWAICDALFDFSSIVGGIPINIIDSLSNKVHELTGGKLGTASSGGQAAADAGTTTPQAQPTSTPSAKQPAALAGTNMQATDTVDADGNKGFDITWKK